MSNVELFKFTKTSEIFNKSVSPHLIIGSLQKVANTLHAAAMAVFELFRDLGKWAIGSKTPIQATQIVPPTQQENDPLNNSSPVNTSHGQTNNNSLLDEQMANAALAIVHAIELSRKAQNLPAIASNTSSSSNDSHLWANYKKMTDSAANETRLPTQNSNAPVALSSSTTSSTALNSSSANHVPSQKTKTSGQRNDDSLKPEQWSRAEDPHHRIFLYICNTLETTTESNDLAGEEVYLQMSLRENTFSPEEIATFKKLSKDTDFEWIFRNLS